MNGLLAILIVSSNFALAQKPTIEALRTGIKGQIYSLKDDFDPQLARLNLVRLRNPLGDGGGGSGGYIQDRKVQDAFVLKQSKDYLERSELICSQEGADKIKAVDGKAKTAYSTLETIIKTECLTVDVETQTRSRMIIK